METETWKDFQNGNKAAFEKIYSAHWQSLLKYTYSVIQDRNAAKDILQEYFMEIWEKRKVLPVPENTAAFLLFVLKHRIMNALRREHIREKHINIFSSLKEAAADNQVANAVLFREALQQLHEQVAALPPRMRQVFRMKFLEDMPVDQIAASLDISDQTVRNQLNAATHRLKAQLKNSFLALFL